MSNALEKDTIGEHEGWLNNPLLTFFVGILLLSLFSILGNQFQVGARTQSQDALDRAARFETINQWRSDSANHVDLDTASILATDDAGKATTYQIPLSDARESLKQDLK